MFKKKNNKNGKVEKLLLQHTLKKYASDMSSEQRQEVLGASMRQAVDKALRDATPNMIITGSESAYISLYEKYVKKLIGTEGERSADKEEIDKLCGALLVDIQNKALKAKAKREKMIKDKEVSKNESE